MTVSSGFFNSVNHDRLYDAEQLSSIFDGIIIDGVYENYGEAFMVTANPDANSSVIIGTGRAWFDHTWTVNDSQFAMQLDPPNELLGRTDAIVIDIDRTQDVRKNDIIYVKGSESTPDLPPNLINENDHKQYPLAYITRPAGSDSVVTQSNITIQVGTNGDCPVVTGILEAQNLSNLWSQLNDEFDTWWDGIKDILDENTVTNLQNQINEIKEQINSDTALVGLLEKPIAEAFKTGNYGISMSSTNLSGKTTSNNEYVLEPLFNTITFLPDGSVVRLSPHFGKSSDLNTSTIYVSATFVSTDGVISSQEIELNNLANSRPFGSSADVIYMYPIFSDINSFPVSFTFLIIATKYAGLDTGAINLYGWTVTFKITSQKAIHTTVGSLNTYTGLSSYIVDFYEYFSNAIITDEGDAIVGFIAFAANSLPYTKSEIDVLSTFKVSPDLIVTNKIQKYLSASAIPGGRVAVNSVPLRVEKNGNNTIVYLMGYAENGLDENGAVISINNIDLQGTVTTKTPDYTNGYITSYESSSYSFSEQNGIQRKSVPIGNKNDQSQQERILNYFSGASNYGGLVEGDFIGMRDIDDRFYGYVGSQAIPVAVGSNGGAAFLKTPGSISAPIDFSKIVKWLKGQYVGDNFNGYLLCESTGNYPFYTPNGSPYALYGTAQNATVIYVKREV